MHTPKLAPSNREQLKGRSTPSICPATQRVPQYAGANGRETAEDEAGLSIESPFFSGQETRGQASPLVERGPSSEHVAREVALDQKLANTLLYVLRLRK